MSLSKERSYSHVYDHSQGTPRPRQGAPRRHKQRLYWLGRRRLLGGGGGLLDQVLLEQAHELGLLVRRLEAAVAELGRRIDELEVDLLLRARSGRREPRVGKILCTNPLRGEHAGQLMLNWAMRS